MTKNEQVKKDKERILEHLRSVPIVEVACKKSGISRATYYRWRNDDAEFLQASEDALADGVEMVNDLTESQLLTLIKEKKMPAITLWLRHNHPRFLLRDKDVSSRSRPDAPLSKNQEKTLKNALDLFN